MIAEHEDLDRAVSTDGDGGAEATLAERFRATRAFTEALCQPLATEDYVIQTMPDVSPTKWHLAHTAWFFETFVLEPRAVGYATVHPLYNYLFNSYYNAVGYRHCRPKRGLISRPTVEEVYAYRAHIDGAMESLFSGDINPFAPVVELGIQHEQQHQELLLTDIKHVLSENPLFPAYHQAVHSGSGQGASGTETGNGMKASELRWAGYEAGLREFGHAGNGFCFDNERPRHKVYVHGFQLATRLSTNREYLEFMEDGGYERVELWLSAGWNVKESEGWRAPLYWQEHDDGWKSFTLSGVRPIDGAEPVCHLSYYEADAFARWAGARLPSEFEWELAARELPVEGNLAESRRFHPAPALTIAQPVGTALPAQMYGDVWEWTRSDYAPYFGYAPGPGALGEYNGKFMSGQYVLRGGSCATSQSHVRSTYRNFFPPDARWQFSGVRLARDGS